MLSYVIATGTAAASSKASSWSRVSVSSCSSRANWRYCQRECGRTNEKPWTSAGTPENHTWYGDQSTCPSSPGGWSTGVVGVLDGDGRNVPTSRFTIE